MSHARVRLRRLQRAAAAPSILALLAASMSPGTFAELTDMGNWELGGGRHFLMGELPGCNPGGPYPYCTTSSDYITQFMGEAPYNPIAKEIQFIGATHGNSSFAMFAAYMESLHAWQEKSFLQDTCKWTTAADEQCFRHGYDHNTVDPVTGISYYRDNGSRRVYKHEAGIWSRIADITGVSVQFSSSLKWFRDRNKMLFADGEYGIEEWTRGTNTWAGIANTGVDDGFAGKPNLSAKINGGATWMAHDPVNARMLIGSNQGIVRYEADGTFGASMSDLPIPCGTNSDEGRLVVCPVSGKGLLLGNTDFYEINTTTGAATSIEGSVTVPALLRAGLGVGDGMVHTQIVPYGVVMLTKYTNSDSRSFLYKHAA